MKKARLDCPNPPVVVAKALDALGCGDVVVRQRWWWCCLNPLMVVVAVVAVVVVVVVVALTAIVTRARHLLLRINPPPLPPQVSPYWFHDLQEFVLGIMPHGFRMNYILKLHQADPPPSLSFQFLPRFLIQPPPIRA